MKKLAINLALFLAVVVGVVWYFSTSPAPVSYEQEVLVADTEESGDRVLAAQYRAALTQYPEASTRVIALYGANAEFRDAVKKYGHNTLVPVVARCLEGGDSFLEMGNMFEQAVSSLTQFRWPNNIQRLTAEECGWRIILLTQGAGERFLAQFIVDKDGHARRLPTGTAVGITQDILIGGIQGLERKLVLNESTSWKDWGAAALDAAALTAATKAVALVAKARLARAGVASTRLKIAEARTGLAAFAASNAPRVAKYATIGGIGYLAVYHPGVISGAARTIAEVLGFDPLLIQTIVWSAILAIPLLLIVNVFSLLRALWLIAAAPARFARWCYRRVQARKAGRAYYLQ